MLREVVKKYLELFPEDKPKLKLLLDQIGKGEQLNTRHNYTGHIAGDALILSPDLKKMLLIYHKHSARWQQPGGHWDPDEAGPWLTSKREAYEETGVKIKKRINLLGDDERVPLQIVTGTVEPRPARKEPFHWHHDFRYGFIAGSEALGDIQDQGVGGAKWVPIEKIPNVGSHNLQTGIKRLKELLKA